MHSATFIWAKVIGDLEEQLGAVTVSAWFDDAELIELSDRELILFSPSDFRREIILRNCKSYVEEALQARFGLRLQLRVWGEEELKKHRQDKEVQSFRPQFCFDTFIAGPSNELPMRAALRVAEEPGGPVYNPLYFFGTPGVGKTHLLHAIADRISRTRPDAKVVYVKGDQFTNDLVQSIMRSDTAEFRRKYRRADVLLVDDIQFIAGKEATQEEFFHTFNELYESNKQIVITSDRTPGEMATLEERLKGRFGSGVMMKIEAPDLETRKRIVRSKAESLRLRLDGEMVTFLAQTLCDNVRQIEGGLRKLRAYQDLANVSLTMENIPQMIADIQTSESRPVITPDTVVRYVCRYYGVEQEQLLGKQRSKNIAQPRQVAIYLIRSLTSMSLTQIGRFFGRDHGTIHHTVKKVEECRAGDSTLENILQDIKTNIETNA